jgi:uncharacterized protein YdcH (DUF465 family)
MEQRQTKVLCIELTSFIIRKETCTPMDIATTDTLKEELIRQDAEFRELAKEHSKYEQRLSELSSLAYPSDEEQLEEITLKKKKLAIKDVMHSMMMQYQKSHASGH